MWVFLLGRELRFGGVGGVGLFGMGGRVLFFGGGGGGWVGFGGVGEEDFFFCGFFFRGFFLGIGVGFKI